MLPTGEDFTTLDGTVGRRVTSWFFGDGADLLTQVSMARGLGERVTSLNPALTSSARLKPGFVYGGRVQRLLNSRFGVEFGVEIDYRIAEFSQAAINVFNLSDSTYSTLNAVLMSVPSIRVNNQFIGVRSSGGFGVSGRRWGQIVATGALNVHARTKGPTVPYISIAGLFPVTVRAFHEWGHELNYNFRISPGASIDQTDDVTIRTKGGDGFGVLLGAGFKRNVGGRSGIRAEARLIVSPNDSRVLLTTRPTSVQAGVGTVSVGPGPWIQFSRDSNRVTSLSAPAVTEFEAFMGTGIRMQLLGTFGYFFRLGR
jgi:hypothetical protein